MSEFYYLFNNSKGFLHYNGPVTNNNLEFNYYWNHDLDIYDIVIFTLNDINYLKTIKRNNYFHDLGNHRFLYQIFNFILKSHFLRDILIIPKKDGGNPEFIKALKL